MKTYWLRSGENLFGYFAFTVAHNSHKEDLEGHGHGGVAKHGDGRIEETVAERKGTVCFPLLRCRNMSTLFVALPSISMVLPVHHHSERHERPTHAHEKPPSSFEHGQRSKEGEHQGESTPGFLELEARYLVVNMKSLLFFFCFSAS